MLRSAALTLAFACGSSAPPDILLVTVDTTRADHLGIYGATPSPSPALDQLGSNGLVFEEAMSVTPLTAPAHSSIMTGRYPTRHGVRSNGRQLLGESEVTIAECLSEKGYTTAAFVAAPVLDPAFGLSQGFQTYSAPTPQSGPMALIAYRPASQVVDAFAEWLAGTAAEPNPHFVWVHVYDPHYPWTSHAGETASYDGEISYMDDQLGTLIGLLGRLRDRERVVVVAGDHGEGLGEHEEDAHGFFVYRSTMRVPLMLSGTGITPGRRTDTASLVDIAPTLAEVSGATNCLQSPDGSSLLHPLGDRTIYGETFLPRDDFGLSQLRVVQDKSDRYIQAPTPELYRWRQDPNELSPQTAIPGTLVAAMAEYESAEVVGSPADLDPNLQRQLEALGYVSMPASSVASGQALGNPMDHAGDAAHVHQAIHNARSVPPEQGVPMLEQTLARVPGAVALRWTLSRGYELLGRHQDAIDVLGAATDPRTRTRTAEMHLTLDADRALIELRQLHTEGEATASSLLAEHLRRHGDIEGAALVVSEAAARGDTTPILLLIGGLARLEQSRWAEAESALRGALRRDPELPEVRYYLGIALAEQGIYAEALNLFRDERLLSGASNQLDSAEAKCLQALGDPAAAAVLLGTQL